LETHKIRVFFFSKKKKQTLRDEGKRHFGEEEKCETPQNPSNTKIKDKIHPTKRRPKSGKKMGKKWKKMGKNGGEKKGEE